MDNKATSITAITSVNVAITPYMIISYYIATLMNKEDCIKGLSQLGWDNLKIIEEMEGAQEQRDKNIKKYGMAMELIKINIPTKGGLELYRVYTQPSSQDYAI